MYNWKQAEGQAWMVFMQAALQASSPHTVPEHQVRHAAKVADLALKEAKERFPWID